VTPGQPKPKPWKSRSRKSHDREQRSEHEAEEARMHSKSKSKRKADRHKYAVPANIQDNPFFKDIFENPKTPKDKKRREVAPEHKLRRKDLEKRDVPILPPPVAKKPVNLPGKKTKAGKTVGPKLPKIAPPPPPPLHNHNVLPPVHQIVAPQYPVDTMPAPNFQEQPPLASHAPANMGASPHLGLRNEATFPGHQPPKFQAAGGGRPLAPAPTQNANQLLKIYRDHYSQPQFQVNPLARWRTPAEPDSGRQYRQAPPDTQPQTNVNHYELSMEYADLQAKHEQAQRDLAAATEVQDRAEKHLARLKAKGPDIPKARSSSKHDYRSSGGSYIAELERNARLAAEEAESARLAVPKHLRPYRSKNVTIKEGSPDRRYFATVEDYTSADERESIKRRERRRKDREAREYSTRGPNRYADDDRSSSHGGGSRRHRQNGSRNADYRIRHHPRPREIPHDVRYEMPPQGLPSNRWNAEYDNYPRGRPLGSRDVPRYDGYHQGPSNDSRPYNDDDYYGYDSWDES